MCGILCTISNKVIEREEFLNSLNLMRHRGPDNIGYKSFFNNSFLNLGHVRLSIQDLSNSANQPLEVDEYVLIYNGEIYNFKELKSTLLKDIDFKTDSDSEVILRGFIKYGIDFFNEIFGMYAFAIFDKRKNEVIVHRDDIGIKPLYIYERDGLIAFSSEIKSLKCLPTELSISETDIFEFLNVGFLYEPNTGFNEIKKIFPGEIFKINMNSKDLKIKSMGCVKRNLTDLPLEKVFKEVMNNQLISDAPLGIFFSGGVDSSVLAAYSDSAPLIFLNYGENNPDTIYAKRISKYLQNKMQIVNKKLSEENADDLISSVKFVAENTEELISDYTFYSSYLLSQVARDQGYKAMLSGMGGDEIFMGYPRYKLCKYRNFFKLLIYPLAFLRKLGLIKKNLNKVERFISFFSKESIPAYNSLLGYFSEEDLEEMFDDKYKSYNDNYLKRMSIISKELDFNLNNLDSIKKLDQRGFLSHNLAVADKSSMLASIEMRVPLLDQRLIYNKIDNVNEVNFFNSKISLIKLLSLKLSKSLFKRKKIGFNPPLKSLIDGIGEENLIKQLEFRNEMISKSYIRTVISDHFKRSSDNSYKIWSLLYLSTWIDFNSNHESLE